MMELVVSSKFCESTKEASDLQGLKHQPAAMNIPHDYLCIYFTFLKGELKVGVAQSV